LIKGTPIGDRINNSLDESEKRLKQMFPFLQNATMIPISVDGGDWSLQ